MDPPDLGIKLGSHALQVDSLLTELLEKPKNIGVGSLSLLQGIFPTQELNQSLLHCKQILHQQSYFRSDRKSTRLNSITIRIRMPSSAWRSEFNP